MATTKQTIDIVFQGIDRTASSISTVTSGLQGMSRWTGDLSGSIESATAPLASLAGGILKADAAMVALAAGGLAYAFSKSKDFENATIDLQKVLGDNTDQLILAQDNARELSKIYGEASPKILQTTANFKQAGFTIEESMQLSKDAIDLVIAGGVDAAQSSEILIAALKGFRAPASEATRLLDILNEVSNNYATDVEQLAIGMSDLSPIARSMGFTMEETAGILTPVIEIFRSGGEAAIALKTGLLRLIDDSKPVKDALASIGVSQTDANGALRSGKDILHDVATAFLTLEQDQKLFVTAQLVGIQQSARMVEVFDGLAKSSEITAVAMNAAGSAAGEVAVRLQSAEVSVNRFREGFTNLAITIGDEFRVAAKEAVDGGTAIENALDDAIGSGALDPLFDVLEKKLNSIGVMFNEVAKNLPEALGDVDFSDLLRSLDTLEGEIARAFNQIFDGIDLTTPEGMTEAIQKTVDAIEGLINVTTGMVRGAEPFIEWLADAADKLIDMDDASQEAIGSAAGFGGAINQLMGPIQGLLGAVDAIGTALQLMAGASMVRAIAALTGSGGLVGAMTGAAGGAAALIGTIAGTAGIIAVVGAATFSVGTLIKTIWEWQEAEDELAMSQERGADAAESLNQKYAKISEQTGVNVATTEEFHQAIKDGLIVADKAAGVWRNAADAQEQQSAVTETSTEATVKNSNALIDWGKVMKDSIIDVDKGSDAQEKLIASMAAYYESIGNTPEIARRMAEMEAGRRDEIEKTTEATDDAIKKTDEFRIKMEELASNERIKSMEFVVDVRIAQIEADAEKFKSTMSSIDASIESTGKLLGDLYDSFGSAKSLTDKWFIKDQIEGENRRRDEASRLQSELAQTQIEMNKARVDRIKAGDALIKITGEGLEPEIEAFMFKIMERIQVRVNEDAAEFLIGMGGA